MINLSHLPSPIETRLLGRYGTPIKHELRRGLTQATVHCLWFEAHHFVVKMGASAREVAFYQTIAPALRHGSVPIPVLEWAYNDSTTGWSLVLELIPQPLPRERWLADVELLQVLAQLHAFSRPLEPIALFRPQWTSEMSAAALSYFPTHIQSNLQPLLSQLQAAAQHLFEPVGWISGDPNPTNWGLRHNNQIVLFDWERFGRGHPALDLGITVPGLGDKQAYDKVAAEYLKHRSESSEIAARLSQNIALAKVWSMIEFLHTIRAGKTRDGIDLEQWLTSLPDWIAQVSEMTRLDERLGTKI